MSKFLVYVPDGELFDTKYALLQFATVVSDEAHLVAIESEADFADVQKALAKIGKQYLVLRVGDDANADGKGDADLSFVIRLLAN